MSRSPRPSFKQRLASSQILQLFPSSGATIMITCGIFCEHTGQRSGDLYRRAVRCISSRSRGYSQSEEARRPVPQVLWPNSKVKLDIMWPGRFERFNDSDSCDLDATRDSFLKTWTEEDKEISSPPKGAALATQCTTATLPVVTREVQAVSP